MAERSPIDVLRCAICAQDPVNYDGWVEALAQVEALVEAAESASWHVPEKVPLARRALFDALAPFVGRDE